MIEAILALVCIGSAYALLAPDLLHGAIALSTTSVLSALLFFKLHAPDVAITEAAVGAGVSTIIFVWAIRETDRRDRS
ncbi:MAG: DUF4040 domain-containing protein [Spirochaetia bacterium]|jgi:uncharacterized MnhB-related membrane protein|nr:DUF4040 domain-containing protein [Spirochaetia bacterium]